MGIEKMISVAVGYGLIGDYRLSPDVIRLRIGDSERLLDPEEARYFLSGLLHGYRRVLTGQEAA